MGIKNLLILIAGIIILCSIININAFEFDNIVKYSDSDMKVEIVNTFGLGKTLGTLELKSHKSIDEVKVIDSMDKGAVIWYDVNFIEDYSEGLGIPKFYDLDGNEIKKSYRYVSGEISHYEIIKEVDKCTDNIGKNGTYTSCSYKNISIPKYTWTTFKSKSIIKGNRLIGIAIDDLKVGETFDIVFEIAGKKLDKHAFVSVYDAHGQSLGGGYTVTRTSGTFFWANKNITIQEVVLLDTVAPSLEGGYCYLNETNGTSIAVSSAISGSNVTFPTNSLIAGTRYSLACDLGGLTYGRARYFTDCVDQWSNHTNINYSYGFHAGLNVCGISDSFDWIITIVGIKSVEILTIDNPVISLNVPTDATNTSSNMDDFEFNMTLGLGGGGWDNYTFYVWNSTDDAIKENEVINGVSDDGCSVVSSGIDYIRVECIGQDISDGVYDWNVYGCSNNSLCDWASSNYTFTVDTIYPIINIINITPIIYNNGDNVSINYTITDSNLDTCWKEYNDVNSSFACSSGINASLNITSVYPNVDIIFWANDSIGNTNSSSFSFAYDTVAPNITINLPINPTNYGYINKSEELNWTITDINLDSIWYEYNETNTTLYGASNTSSFILEPNLYNLTVWANDTLGNTASLFREWEYKIFINNQSYDLKIPEGALDEFELELTTKDGVSLTQAILNYNNTNYTTSVLYSSGNYTITASIYSPIVTEDTNFSFNFFLIVDGDTYELDASNQTVFNLNFGECGGISNDTFINIFLKDEIEKTALVGDIEVGGIIVSKSSGLEVATIYQEFNSTNNASICFSPPSDYDLYYFNSEIKYSADNYASEIYIIQQADMGEYPKNLSLYDLNSNYSTEFLIKYQDDNLITVEGAVIQILRKYISEGIYETVEAPLTSNIGTTIAHIDLNTNLYKAIVVKDGEVLDIFNNLVFNCESELSGICTQNLFGSIDPQNAVSVDVLEDFIVVVTEVNNTITTTFSIPSGSSALINVLLEQEDVFGNSYLCNQTVTSSSGSLDCDYNDTIGDSIVRLKISKDGVEKLQQSYVIPEAGGVEWLGNNFFIVLILLLSLVGMAMASPEWIIVMGVVTFVLAGGIWLLNGLNFVVGLGSLIWILIVAIILILKLSKQEDK